MSNTIGESEFQEVEKLEDQASDNYAHMLCLICNCMAPLLFDLGMYDDGLATMVCGKVSVILGSSLEKCPVCLEIEKTGVCDKGHPFS